MFKISFNIVCIFFSQAPMGQFSVRRRFRHPRCVGVAPHLPQQTMGKIFEKSQIKVAAAANVPNVLALCVLFN